MTSLPVTPGPKPRLIPRDAATLVLVDNSIASEPRILMGRRRADLAFLANKVVFPGGRVDPADKTADAASELSANTVAALLTAMRGRPSEARARALGIAAIRELHEETGIALGDPACPPLDALTFFARAITPPGRPRRFDTRFFMAEATRARARQPLGGDGELTDLAWLTLDDARRLDLPGITRLIIDDIAVLLPLRSARLSPGIPFYFYRAGAHRRQIL